MILKKLLATTSFLALILIAGCTQEPLVGGDKDEHGCIATAGYTWCEAKQECLREWEEACNETSQTLCAEDGDTFSNVSDKHLDSCCEGLKEWIPIPDTRFSIADKCYEVGSPSESNIGLCIMCGDGVCENHLMYDENPCNCPEDCAGKNKSMFQSIEEFCQSNDWNYSFSTACEETIKDSPICNLC